MLLQFRTFKIVYRRYAGLYFILCVDVTDNEMMYLESIHLFVEVCCSNSLMFDRMNSI
jgi:AP-2 complex subunit sigma-1